MSRLIVDYFTKLQRHYKVLEKTRQKVEYLFNKKLLTKTEVEQTYGTLFTNAVIGFEHFIEELFFDLLTDRLKYNKIKPLVIFKNESIAYNIILGTNSYINWLPYDYTERYADIYFKEGLPFKSITPQDKTMLKKASYIRNALVHRSRFSYSKYEKNVLCNLPLASKEKSPEKFLRGIFTTPSKTRFEIYVEEIASIAQKICT